MCFTYILNLILRTICSVLQELLSIQMFVDLKHAWRSKSCQTRKYSLINSTYKIGLCYYLSCPSLPTSYRSLSANAVQVQTKTKWNYKPCKRCRTSWSLSKYKRMALMTWNIVDRWVSIKINNWRKDNDSQISTSKKNSLITKNWEALEKIIEVFKTKMTHSMLVL